MMEKHLHILPNWHTASQLALLRLPALVEALRTRHSVSPYIGCELEWYVDQPDNAPLIAEVHRAVERTAESHHIRMTAIKPEKGNGQYEVGFDASSNPVALVQAIHDFRALLMQKAARRGLHILWDAKPFANDYGSALQMHIHLEDAAGQRLFVKKDEYLSPSLAASLGGLLDITPEATFVAAPQDSDYARFVPQYDAPVNICWGGNNRTVTLRLPLKTGSRCHIEYRLAGADADPASMCGILLVGVLHGLESKPQPGTQIYGVASDEQYGLPPFPHTREEAKRAFQHSHAAREWMGEEWFEVVSGL
jgi:glutamine synthetase